MNAWSQEFPRQELVFHGRGAGFCLLLKRNCSISPAGLVWAYGLIAIMTMAIATALAVMGAWPVLPFAGVEIVALGIAFFLNGRHAADYERIELDRGRLVVEVGESDSVRRHEFNPARASVVVAGEGHGVRVLLDEKPGRRLEIGRHLQEQARLDLAGELTKRLRN
jgi:uncharacterized membrane protein